MNNTRKIFWASLVLLLAIVITICFQKKPQAPSASLSKPTVESQINSKTSVGPAKTLNAQSNTHARINASMQMSSPQLSREEQWRLATAAHNVPIDFWGKVIDQNGVPLAGVKIVANARFFAIETNGMGVTYFPKTNIVTGTDGLFEIHNMSGDDLTVEKMEKKGYETDPGTLRGFGYNLSENITPDQNNPIIFRMWPEGLKQSSLITGDKHTKIIPDGRPYAIDFTNSVITEAKESEGDLLIQLKRPGVVQRGEKFDWSFTITPMNGGILQDLQTPYSVMTLAPMEGYEDTYESQHYANDNGWKAFESNKRFYVKLRNGQVYGRIQAVVDAERGEMRIQYVVNPSGSPILR